LPGIPLKHPILIHEASCLRASQDVVRIATIQPFGELKTSDNMGPHYSEEKREDAQQRAISFLQLVKEYDAELAIAPEYFTPKESIINIINEPNILRENTIYILPLESISLSDYQELYTTSMEKGINIERTNLESEDGRSGINCCGIIFKVDDNLRIYLQSKICSAPLEKQNLIPGSNFFIFEGENIALLMLICSDANKMRFHDLWASAAAHKSGAFIIHPQWNPQPDFQNYQSFWANILDNEDGNKRIILSLNWAVGSKIIDEDQNQYSIERSRTRSFRGKNLQTSPIFIERSKAGLHVQRDQRAISGKVWEIWHALSPDEHAYIIDMCRPFENVSRPEGSRDCGIRQSIYFERNDNTNHFDECSPHELAQNFWENCRGSGLVDEAHRDLDVITICELELLCNAFMMENYGSWMMKDIAYRIPTAPLVCGNISCQGCIYKDLSCSDKRPIWEEQIQYVVQCLLSFHNNETIRNNQLKIKPSTKYPLNIIDRQNDYIGWLFHGRGLQSRFLEKKINKILKDQKLDTFQGSLQLFVVGITEEIAPENILNQPSDITKSDIEHKPKKQDDPDYSPYLQITILHS